MTAAAKSPFPSALESTAASALLLLSATAAADLASPSLSPLTCEKPDFDAASLSTGRKFPSKIAAEKSSVSSGSRSCISSSPEEVALPAHKLRIVAFLARGHDMKLKVVRKKRSKVYWSSIDRKEHILSFPEVSKSASTENSCLSTTSSAASSSRSRYSSIRTESSCAEKWRKKQSSTSSISGSTHMKQQAESILKLLSRGPFSEVRIRQLLGDSPDTSKALRMLLKREEVKRSGSGGRQDPYIYKVA
ncbi:unnamed protein product [Linum tenue]|uniref:HTH three-helical bundle domain-containing protein n=1 Tax=Linum tenue TaxID=586396 RepID=A0AAV0M0P2_9ROSI|nr:unnamed protein product [Linum tenue]